MSNVGVHQTHCCFIHGCKYGDDDCPVVKGRLEQDYLCESCAWDGLDSMELFREAVKLDSINLEKEDYEKLIAEISDEDLKLKLTLARNARHNLEFLGAY